MNPKRPACAEEQCRHNSALFMEVIMDGAVCGSTLELISNRQTVFSQDHKKMKEANEKKELPVEMAFCGALTATCVEKSVCMQCSM